MQDARISTGLPGHPKTKKLLRRLGPAGPWSLICLFLWTAANRSDGDLSSLSDEDIEIASEWLGETGQFIEALVSVRFLDGEPGAYEIHDWTEHNPWAAGAGMRASKARWNAAKRHHGAAAADTLVPEYAAIRNAGSNANSTTSALLEPESSNAPSPSPSPSPSPKEEKQKLLASDDAASGIVETEDGKICRLVKACYHATLPNCKRVETDTPKRTRKILAAHNMARRTCKANGWTMTAEKFWTAYFEECADDPWMRGDVPNPNNPKWKQNLFTLIDDERFGQIMDLAISAVRESQEKADAH